MYKLTEEGFEYLKKGLPEKNLIKALQSGRMSLEAVTEIPNSTIAVGWARRNGWIRVEKGYLELTENGKKAVSGKVDVEKALEDIERRGETETIILKILISRNLIEEAKEIQREVKEKIGIIERIKRLFFARKEESKAEEMTAEIAQLTPELIKSGKWKESTFRTYDVKAPAPTIYPGKKQPYAQFIEDLKVRLVGLGFQEMKGPIVETLFGIAMPCSCHKTIQQGASMIFSI